MSHHSHRHRHRHRASREKKKSPKSGKVEEVTPSPPFVVGPPPQPAWSYMALDESGSFAYDALRHPDGQVLAYRIMRPEVFSNRAPVYPPNPRGW